jgi:DNA-directed RNA polymerase subunit RPC12/RpoP
MGEQQVACGACGEVVTVRGLDGDGRPFSRTLCTECGSEVDLPDETDAYYSLACEAR